MCVLLCLDGCEVGDGDVRQDTGPAGVDGTGSSAVGPVALQAARSLSLTAHPPPGASRSKNGITRVTLCRSRSCDTAKEINVFWTLKLVKYPCITGFVW